MIISSEVIATLPNNLAKDEQEKYIDLFYNHSDQNAREKLILHNLRLVAFCITKYFPHLDADFDDIFQVGCIGLSKAIDTYIPEKSKLSTYAALCIKIEIYKHIKEHKHDNDTISLYSHINGDSIKDDDELSLINMLSDGSNMQEESIDSLYLQEAMKKLLPYIKALPPTKRQIIEHTFEINGKQKMTQKQLGEMCNISQAHVSRIIQNCLKDFADMLTRVETAPPVAVKATQKEEQPFLLSKQKTKAAPTAKQTKNKDKKKTTKIREKKTENKQLLTAEEFLFAKYFDKDFTAHDKQLLNEFLLKLDDNNRFLFESMFGLNGKEKLKYSEIGATLKISKPSVYRWCQANIKKLSDYLNGLEFENVKKVQYFRLNHKYELIKEYFHCPPPEDRQIIDKFFSSLNEQQLSVFELYFGLNGKKPLNQTEIAQKMNTYANKIFRTIQMCLRKFATIYNESAIITQENKQSKSISEIIKDVRPLRSRAHKYQARKLVDGTKLLFDSFLKKPYTQENMEIVCQYLDRIDDKKRFVFERYFGLNGREELTLENISQKLDVSKNCIWQIVHNCIEKLKHYKTNEQLLFDNYLHQPLTGENIAKVNTFIAALPKKEQTVFIHYFGLNGAKKLKTTQFSPLCSASNACMIIKKLIQQLSQKLDEKAKEN